MRKWNHDENFNIKLDKHRISKVLNTDISSIIDNKMMFDTIEQE